MKTYLISNKSAELLSQLISETLQKLDEEVLNMEMAKPLHDRHCKDNNCLFNKKLKDMKNTFNQLKQLNKEVENCNQKMPISSINKN